MKTTTRIALSVLAGLAPAAILISAVLLAGCAGGPARYNTHYADVCSDAMYQVGQCDRRY